MLEWDALLDHEINIDSTSPIVYGSSVETYLSVESYQLDWTRWI